MKRLLFGAMLGLASIASLPTARAAERPACQSADAVRSQAEVGSAQHGGAATRLDGVEAVVFLDYLNTKIGEPTDYKGDSLIIGFYPDLGYALVGFVVNGCADQKNLVKLDVESFLRAYRAARGVAV